MIGGVKFIFADMAVLLLIGVVFLAGGVGVLRQPPRSYRYLDAGFQIAVALLCFAGMLWLNWALVHHRI